MVEEIVQCARDPINENWVDHDVRTELGHATKLVNGFRGQAVVVFGQHDHVLEVAFFGLVRISSR